MAMNVSITFVPSIPGGIVNVANAASFSAAKTAAQTEVQNRLTANQNDAQKFQDALASLNS